MSYGDYLQLDRVLAAQTPRSRDHNEMLFIVQHQATELWMKLMLHELRAARDHVRAGELQPAFKMLARVARIMAQLNQSWDVLSTLTPAEYSSFRDSPRQLLGLPVVPVPHDRVPARQQERGDDGAAPPPRRPLRAAGGAAPRALALRRGDPPARAARLRHRPLRRRARLVASRTRSTSRCCEAWVAVYRSTGEHWELYELAEKLVDLEDAFRQWRFRHATTVERVIGFKRGTGGTSGVGYLKRVLEVVLFPELWRARTSL